MTEYRSVLVLGETEHGRLASGSRELLGLGRTLANELGEELKAFLVGAEAESAAPDAIACGADEVYIAHGPDLARYNSDVYTAAVTGVCQEVSPSIVLMGQTSIGRDLAPRVASRLGASLSTDCVELRIDPGSKRLVQVRPVYGGNAVATVVSKAYPQIATVRPRTAQAPEPDTSRTGKVTTVELGEIEAMVNVVDVVRETAEGVKIEDAAVVVGGGAGLRGPEDFDMIGELAAVLGGAVGATRQPCEDGWVSSSSQIGQTGKIIAPDLYLAIAISGAPQHMAGCLGSKFIVAVNTDPEAHIFKMSDFGIVADYREAVPALIRKCRELKSAG